MQVDEPVEVLKGQHTDRGVRRRHEKLERVQRRREARAAQRLCSAECRARAQPRCRRPKGGWLPVDEGEAGQEEERPAGGGEEGHPRCAGSEKTVAVQRALQKRGPGIPRRAAESHLRRL